MDELQGIGLTDGEIRVYEALLKIGATKVGKLITESGVSASKTYKILERLEKKGLVGHTVVERTKNYKALPPRSLLEYVRKSIEQLETKLKGLESAIPSFGKMVEKDGGSETFVYHGFRAVKNLLYSLLDGMKPGETYRVMGARYEEGIFGVRPFFKEFHAYRARKRINVKMLANFDAKGNIEPETFKRGTVRFLPKYLMTNMHVFLYGDRTYMVLWAKEPIAFYIRNPDVTRSFIAYFRTFWALAKE